MKKAINDNNKEQKAAALREKMLAKGTFKGALAALYGFDDHKTLATYMRSCGHDFLKYQSELNDLYGIIGCNGLAEDELKEIWEVA